MPARKILEKIDSSFLVDPVIRSSLKQRIVGSRWSASREHANNVVVLFHQIYS